MCTDLEKLKAQIETGKPQAVREALKTLTAKDPFNIDAWELLASVSKDPHEQAECYRQLLQIDPGNRQAATRLLEITAQIHGATPPQEPTHEFDPILYCKQCGGPAEVRFVGDLHDKRAICSYCGTEVDLPDSYFRIQKLREQSTLSGTGQHTVESIVDETPQEGLTETRPIEDYPPELQQIIKSLRERGSETITLDDSSGDQEYPIDEERGTGEIQVEDHQETPGQDVETPDESRDSETTPIPAETRKDLRSIFSLPFLLRRKADRRSSSLSIEERVLLSADPLPPEERRNCPNPSCEAVISKFADQCPWCGEQL
jgi:hypothetical protein